MRRRDSSGELYARNPFKVAAVSGEQRATAAGHDAGDQTVGHPNGITGPFERSADLTGRVGGRVVQPQRRHCREQLNQAGKLLRILRTREEFKPAEVIDEDIRIGNGHRQFARILRVRVNRPAASVSVMDPFSARAVRIAFVRPL